MEFGPPLSGVFATLPLPTSPPPFMEPTVEVPQVGDGSSTIVEIVIPSLAFQRNDCLRYTIYLCMHYRLDHTVCAISVCM